MSVLSSDRASGATARRSRAGLGSTRPTPRLARPASLLSRPVEMRQRLVSQPPAQGDRSFPSQSFEFLAPLPSGHFASGACVITGASTLSDKRRSIEVACSVALRTRWPSLGPEACHPPRLCRDVTRASRRRAPEPFFRHRMDSGTTRAAAHAERWSTPAEAARGDGARRDVPRRAENAQLTRHWRTSSTPKA
jgi:hypothetical protein